MTDARSFLYGKPLSPREQQVLTLLGDGFAVPAIAITLYLSPGTVAHIKRGLFRKLGVVDVGQAVAVGRELGLIGIESKNEGHLPLNR